MTGCKYKADRCSSGPRKKANYILKRLEIFLRKIAQYEHLSGKIKMALIEANYNF